MSKDNKITRREFLSYSAVAGVARSAGLFTASFLVRKQQKTAYVPLKAPGEYYIPELPDKAADGKELKAGVIGCGGRGSGAARTFWRPPTESRSRRLATYSTTACRD